MTVLTMTRDANGYNTFARPGINKYKYATTLATGVVQSLTVPATGSISGNKMLAIFSPEPGSSIWVAVNEAAAIPGGAFALTTSERNPTAYEVKAGDVLSFITGDDSATIGVVFYDLTI